MSWKLSCHRILVMQLSLDLLSCREQLKVKKEKGQKKIFDPIRKQWYVWQPEELVRQLLIAYLITAGFNKNRIHVERGILVHGDKKRCDIIIYDKDVSPYLLIECKAPSVAITQQVFDQIAQYNFVYQVPYLLVSNGIYTYCCAMDYTNKTYTFKNTLPDPK